MQDTSDHILKTVTDVPNKEVNNLTINSHPIGLLCPQSNGVAMSVKKDLVQIELTNIASSIHKEL